MTRSAKRSWRRRGAAGFSANMPSATATPTPAWCSTRWRGSRKRSPRRRQPAARQPARRGAGRDPRARSMRRRAAAAAALDDLALEENLAPVRKGARVIREIAWRLREIGADGRICDLIDSQVSAIEAACGQIASTDPAAALSAAFDLIEGTDRGVRRQRRAAPAPAAKRLRRRRRPPKKSRQPRGASEDAGASARPAASDEAPMAVVETAPWRRPQARPKRDASRRWRRRSRMVARLRPLMRRLKPPTIAPKPPTPTTKRVLDMVALEMAAPDPADVDDAARCDSR